MSKNTTPRQSLVYITYLILAFILIIAAPAKAQDCGCDHVISLKSGFIRATDMPNVKPGDVVCIQAGVRSRLKFVGFHGTKEQPIIFKNCGGQVIFDRAVDGTTLEGSLIFDKSSHFRVTGTGSPNHKYGFLIRKTNGSALHATESDFEIDHIEIAHAGFAGIFAKIEALCNNTEYHRGNFVMDNISIHDNYIHDTHGEGMYIGSSWWHGKKMECGTLFPPELHNLKVYNNIVENAGADGMQIGCAAKNAEVYNNTIRNYGFNPFSPVHTNGLMINGGYQGKIYNNQIYDGAGMGLNCFGIGNVYMYNNLVVRPGTDGIFIDERGPVLPGAGFHTHNNTVISPKRDGIRMYSRNSVGNTFINNIVVAPGSLGTNYYNKDQYLYIIDANVKYSQNNNLFLPTVSEAQFLNATADDYKLKESSPAVDKGALLNYITFDFNRQARPQGAGYDIGAFEFGGSTHVINEAPVVTAGADKTLSLPANSTTLTATATDADGTIASVKWVKLSGPSATLSGTATLTLGLSNLIEGEYLFRFTATDNKGATASDDVLVTVKGAADNIAPVANAGADQSITLPTSSLTLNGTATDQDGTVASVKWTKVSGPAATLSDASLFNLALSNLAEGTYTFRFTATDNAGASSSDDVMIVVNPAVVVPNIDPVVSAGEDRSIMLPTNKLGLRGTASDADGTIASINWSKVSGPAATIIGATTLTPALDNLLEGTYTFRLTVKDNDGATAWDEVQVQVNPDTTTTTPVAENNGINYFYYTAVKKNTWSKLPDFSTLTPDKTGIVGNFNLEPKTQNDFFGFVYKGYLEIKEAGNYTFYTSSDEGSQLYVKDELIAHNEGSNTVQERSGTLHLTAGFHPIRLNYFERNGSEKLEVSYTGPGIERMIIPSAVLFTTAPETTTDPDPATAPTMLGIDEATSLQRSAGLQAPENLTVRYNSQKGTAKLSWIDTSNGETGFEVFMATGSPDAVYVKVGSTGENKQVYTVVNLVKNESYHLKVRARTRLNFSEYTNTVSINGVEANNLSSLQNGQRILINFNFGKNAAAPWNNMDQDPDPMDEMAGLKDEQGNSTSINLTLLTSWGWAATGGNGWNNLGTTTGNDTGAFPDDVMRSCFWTERSEEEVIEISGLQANQHYRFTFFGSRDASGDRTTHYRIAKKKVSLNASYNTKKKVSISNAKADANGKIKVYVQKGDKAIFGYLNAMVIEATGYIAPGTQETEALRGAYADNNGPETMERSTELGVGFQTFSAYPNPATDHIILHYYKTTPYSQLSIQLIDLTGNIRLASEETANDENGTVRIDLDPTIVPAGYYLLKIRSESGVKTIKFMKL